MKNVVCSAARDEINPCFCLSLVELLVPTDSTVTVWKLGGFAICPIIV